MTDAIGPSVSDVAGAVMAARQANQRSPSTDGAAQSAVGGRTGNENDSVTLSEAAQKIIKLQDGTELTALPLDKLRLITPQGLRSDAEAGLQAIMADLGIEDDLELSIEVGGDGAIMIESADPRAAELEAAINADPALQKTLRELRMTSAFAYQSPMMREAFEAMRANEDRPVTTDSFAQMRAALERTDSASYTLTMTQGSLTTAFVDAAGARFGGVAPEPLDQESV